MRSLVAPVAIFATLVLTLAASGQTLSSVSNPSIKDGSGKLVGHILGYGSDSYAGGSVASVLFKYNSSDSVILRMQKPLDGTLNWVSGPLFYTTGDCTGQVYLTREPGVADRDAAVGPGNVLFVSDTGVSHPVLVHSYFVNSQCSVATFSINSATVTSAGSLDTQFHSPFTIVDSSAQSVTALSVSELLVLVLALAIVGLVLIKR